MFVKQSDIFKSLDTPGDTESKDMKITHKRENTVI